MAQIPTWELLQRAVEEFRATGHADYVIEPDTAEVTIIREADDLYTVSCELYYAPGQQWETVQFSEVKTEKRLLDQFYTWALDTEWAVP